jgi:hypothetical protein
MKTRIGLANELLKTIDAGASNKQTTDWLVSLVSYEAEFGPATVPEVYKLLNYASAPKNRNTRLSKAAVSTTMTKTVDVRCIGSSLVLGDPRTRTEHDACSRLQCDVRSSRRWRILRRGDKNGL